MNFSEDDVCLNFLREDSDQSQPLFNLIEKTELEDRELKLDTEGQARPQSRSTKKTFYYDKMAELLQDNDEVSKLQYNYVDNCDRSKVPINREEQLKRNRESAKHSRERKKEYISTLEGKYKDIVAEKEALEIRIAELEKENRMLKESKSNLPKELEKFASRKNSLYQQLAELLERPQEAQPRRLDQDLASKLRQISNEYGVEGVQRLKLLDYYMNQILENIIGDIHKYLIVNSGEGFFTQGNDLDKSIFQILHVSRDQQLKLANKYKSRMLPEYASFRKSTEQFYQQYLKIIEQAHRVESIVEQFQREFSVRRLGSCLVWFQQNKFRTDIKHLKWKWLVLSKKEEDQDGHTRKLTKIESL